MNVADGNEGEATVNKEIQSFPRRIVCLTEETTETLYLLGEQIASWEYQATQYVHLKRGKTESLRVH
jgi:hypothetical protein